MVSSSWDGTLCILDDTLEAGVLHRSHEHHKDVVCVAVAPEFGMIASAGIDQSVLLYDDSLHTLRMRWQLHHPPSTMIFIKDYPLLIVTDELAGLYIFDSSAPYSKHPIIYFPEFNRTPIKIASQISTSTQDQRPTNASSNATSAATSHSSSTGGVPSAILSFSYNEERRVLCYSDSAGYIKILPIEYALLHVFHPTTRPPLYTGKPFLPPRSRLHILQQQQQQQTQKSSVSTHTTSTPHGSRPATAAGKHVQSHTHTPSEDGHTHAPIRSGKVDRTDLIKRWSTEHTSQALHYLKPSLVIPAHAVSTVAHH